MGNIAIIPARGGSKRIPRKNIKAFLGKPIIAYSIAAALESGLFDEVMVSTDDLEIADIARDFGAVVPFMRSEQNANDMATTVDVILEVLGCYADKDVYFEAGCCIYPTAPFTNPKLLHSTYALLRQRDFDSTFPVVRYGYPIQRALSLEGDKIAMCHPEYIHTRSQDLGLRYHDSGQHYWFRTDQIIQTKKLWSDHTGAIVISDLHTQDIDTMDDWLLAEMKYKLFMDGK